MALRATRNGSLSIKLGKPTRTIERSPHVAAQVSGRAIENWQKNETATAVNYAGQLIAYTYTTCGSGMATIPRRMGWTTFRRYALRVIGNCIPCNGALTDGWEQALWT